MKNMHIEWAGRYFEPAITHLKLSAAMLLGTAATLTAQAGQNHRVPDLPEVCDHIAVSADNQAVFHVFAVGVQIYRWDGTNWGFVAPEATLYADAKHRAEVGTHFATSTGPAWQIGNGNVFTAAC